MSEEHDTVESSPDEDESSDDNAAEVDNAPGSSSGVVKNPFFAPTSAKRVKTESSSEDNSDDFIDSSDEEEEEAKPEPVIDDEDPLIKALKKAKEKSERKSPNNLKHDEMITDLSFHPKSCLIAYSDINGRIFLNEYNNEENIFKAKNKSHKGSARSIEFESSGAFLVSGGADKSVQVIDSETFRLVLKVPNAHESPLYKVKPLNSNLLATGDEDGCIKLWDRRQSSDLSKAVMEDNSLDEAITDIFYDPNVDAKYIIASSQEGVIQGYNLAGKKADVQSEVYEGELNCMAIVHRNSKLVAGCGDGKLYMFNWKQFGYHSAEFPGHPDAINAMLAVTDNVVITACEDGVIRAVHLYPHRFIGTVGHHEKRYPVEKLDVSHDGELIASISHDECVKFWSIKYLEEMDYEKTKKPFQQLKRKMRRKENKMLQAQETEFQLPSSNRGNRQDFFKGLEDDD